MEMDDCGRIWKEVNKNTRHTPEEKWPLRETCCANLKSLKELEPSVKVV